MKRRHDFFMIKRVMIMKGKREKRHIHFLEAIKELERNYEAYARCSI